MVAGCSRAGLEGVRIRFTFGSIQLDGVTYGYDVVIDGRRIRQRKKTPSKRFRGAYYDSLT